MARLPMSIRLYSKVSSTAGLVALGMAGQKKKYMEKDGAGRERRDEARSSAHAQVLCRWVLHAKVW